MEQQSAITTTGLTKRYGKTTALDGVDLRVPRGSVFALVGRNGAGKTTLIQVLLGLASADGGTGRVLGLDPSSQGVEIRRKVGFVPDQHNFPRWMTIAELVHFTGAFFPTWNDQLCGGLLDRFGLDPKQKIKGLSRGMLAQTALCLALAHEPEVLVLDEPTGGLDAVVRREFMEQVLGAAADEGRTILISSHMLDELDRVADHVGYLEEGRLHLAGPVESLKARIREYRLTFSAETPDHLDDPAWLATRRTTPHEWTVAIDCPGGDPEGELRQRFPGASVKGRDLSLEEMFVALAKKRGGGNGRDR
jgi:ABC-2 type transport system ATP-binding protein